MTEFPERDAYGRPRTPYAVTCVETFDVRPSGCGLVYLTKQEYDTQMSYPDSTWRCPLCRGSAIWNDDNYEHFLESQEDTNDYGTCYISNVPHLPQDNCQNWQPLPKHVEITRFNSTTLGIESDGAAWIAPDTMFTNVRHEGIWSSKHMRFISDVEQAQDKLLERRWSDTHFSDGTPVAIYERDKWQS